MLAMVWFAHGMDGPGAALAMGWASHEPGLPWAGHVLVSLWTGLAVGLPGHELILP